MMRTVTVVKQYLVAMFFILIGLMAYGCGDSASVNPEVELASLTVTPGTLQPGFSGGTTQYRVDVTTDTTSVTVMAQPAVSGDTVTIDGQATTNRAITLDPPGSTTVINIVVSETDTNSRTYVIRVVRAGLAGNNSLQNLTVSPGTPPIAFNENTLSYTVDVANTVGSVAVTPTLQDPAATVTVNGLPATSAQARTVNLNPAGQSTLITIEVTAQNDTKKSYTILVNRGGLSGINNLQGLIVSAGTGTTNLISFSPGTLTYPVDVASTVTTVTVRPTLPPNSNASISIRVNNGQPANISSGQSRSIPLGVPDSITFINIIVTAQNGNRNTYVVAVDRAPSNDNNLSALRVNGSSVPGFTRGTLNYTVNVARGVNEVTVSATKSDRNAGMTIGSVPVPAGTATGQAAVTLGGEGSDTLVLITITPQSGTSKQYRLTIHRAEPSSNNDLSALSVTAGTAVLPVSPPFGSNTVNVATDNTSVTVTATLQDTNATLEINGQGTSSGVASAPITLGAPGSNTGIPIVVIAPNGVPRNYTVTVSRAAPAAPQAPGSAPDLISADDSCPLDVNDNDGDTVTNECLPPIPPSTTPLDADNITTVMTPGFSIPSPGAGVIPTLYVNGVKDVNSTFTQGILRRSTSFSDGTYTITYTLTNAGGESGQSPAMDPPLQINTIAPQQ